jgi:hypothetical protein
MSIHSLYVGIFYLSGEPISLHLLLCGPFAVDYHSFTGQRLASTANSALELSKVINQKFYFRGLIYQTHLIFWELIFFGGA